MRGRSDCCHYDDGYDDGYDDAKKAGVPDRSVIVSALRFLAYETIDNSVSEVLEATADRLATDQGFEHRMEIEEEREASLAKLYAEQRQVAA